MSNNDFFLFDLALMERVELFDDMVFGRDDSSDVVIEDEMVSGSHFKIKIIDNEVYLVDLESSNQTIVNDVAVLPNKKVKLNVKDVIKVGSQEFAYSTNSVKKLNIPELSATLKIARFDQQSDSSMKIERLENQNVYDEPNTSDCLKVDLPTQKPVTGLKALRNAKKYIEDLENVQTEIHDKIENLKQMRRRKIEVGAKMDQMKKILASSKYQEEKDFEKEMRIHRGTIEGYRMKIQKEEKEIAKAKEIIKKAEEEITQAKFNISSLETQSSQEKEKLDTVNNEYDIFKNKSVYENEFETLKKSIKTYESLDLETKKDEVAKEMKLKKEQLKEMQAHYGQKISFDITKKASNE